ncbi:type VI secretion system baseplate subunit TssF [Paraburkholderia bannensis]|uniref:type VI secretion system baseplate subunit TssF n=1 Tax=Paraburkholderia bannensis TaxID=765414 RepID=UPI002ABD720C|nr:type VI secretion system baseplate subunit TssF [Paraburkholderia bannensis]
MDEFEKLLPLFERELAQFRQDLLQFERAYPKAAARLSMSGGQTDDLHVERMVQSAAWLNARVSSRVEDHYPEFAEALVETVFPAYLRPLPSCSIARFDAGRLFDGLTRTFEVASHTELEHPQSLCRFRTFWDITLAPLAITRAQFLPPTDAPSLGAGRLSRDIAGIVSIELTSPGRRLFAQSELLPRTLRVYLHADRLLTAGLTDTMLLRPHPAFVEADANRVWHALEKHPVKPVGFDDSQALLTGTESIQQPALRMLIEYAAFPAKFRFVDVDLETLLRTTGPCEKLTLHLPVASHVAHPWFVERLRQLNANNLQLFCSPVVNAFREDAKPIDVVADAHRFPVSLPETDGPQVVIHSIDAVYMVNGAERAATGTEIPRYRSLQHWSQTNVFWLPDQANWDATQIAGNETSIKMVDIDGQPVTPSAGKLAVELTCTNGSTPSGIQIGKLGGDLKSEALNLGGPITLLVTPTAPAQPARADQALWRLISALSPNQVSLSPSGLAELRELLYQFSKSASPDAVRHIAGIIGVASQSIKRAMHVDPIPTTVLVPGFRITLAIDETAFAGHPIYTFARLMERYFLRYVGWDCLELSIVSRGDTELYNGRPLLGSPEVSFV